jgi:hypothetical protein
MTSKVSLFHRYIALSTLAASIGLFNIPVSSAQDSSDAPPPPPQAGAQQSQQPPPDQRRVISRDTLGQDPNAPAPPQDPQDQNLNDSPQRPPARNRPPYGQSQAYGTPPDSITVPAGKVIFVRLNEPLSSDHNHAGDTFTATLDQPLVINGWVVARRGETIVGNVTAAQKAGRVKGVSQLGLELTEVTVVDGQQVPVATELWNGSAGTSHGADAAGIATTTGVGAIIGAAANGGEGAGIGAGIGAAAGIAAVLLTRGKPTVLGPETPLSFRLKAPLTVSTANSKQAFLPVGPGDYNSSPALRHRSGPGYPPPYYANCGPYWGCGPYYYPYYGPTFGVGYYGGYWGGYRHGFRR